MKQVCASTIAQLYVLFGAGQRQKGVWRDVMARYLRELCRFYVRTLSRELGHP